jgi:hypothetical protein
MQCGIITEFDKKLWQQAVERIIVYRESEIVVELKYGWQVKVSVIGKRPNSRAASYSTFFILTQY